MYALQTGVREELLGYQYKVSNPLMLSAEIASCSMWFPRKASARVTSTYMQVKVAGGQLLVRPLTQSRVHECGTLLTNAFADAMGYLPVYR